MKDNPFTTPPAPRQPSAGRFVPRYSTFLPFLIVLITLILSTGKDVVILYKRNVRLVVENAQAAEPLRKAGEQARFVDDLRTDLTRIAPTDPVAAHILTDFFPSPPILKKSDTDAKPDPAAAK